MKLQWLLLLIVILLYGCAGEEVVTVDTDAAPKRRICDSTLAVVSQVKKDKEALRGLIESLPENSLALAYAWYEYGKGNVERHKKIDRFATALETFENSELFVVEPIAKLCNNLSNNYFNAEDFAESQRYAAKGIKVILDDGASCPTLTDILVELHYFGALALFRQDEVYEAIGRARSGIDYAKAYGASSTRLGILYTIAGRAMIETGDYPQAERLLDTAETYYPQPSEITDQDQATDLANILDQRQNLAKARGDELLAKEPNARALALRTKFIPKSRVMAHSYNNYGRVLIFDEKYREGERHLRGALELYRKYGTSSDLGTVFESMALAREKRGDTIAALRWLDSAIVSYHGGPEGDYLFLAADKAELRDPLYTKARLLARRQANRPDTLGLKAVEEAISGVDSIDLYLRSEINSEKSKRHVVRLIRSLYGEVVRLFENRYAATGDLSYRELSLRYLERAKARVLREGLSKSMATLYESKGEDPNYSVLPQLAGTIGADEAILDYFVGKDRVLVAVGQNGQANIVPLSVHPDTLSDQVKRFRNAIVAKKDVRWSSNAEWRKEQINELKSLGFGLYRELIAPIFPSGKLPIRLTVIPDGEISRLPFGALLAENVETDDYGEWPFLADRIIFNYRFSALSWWYRTQNANPTGKRVLVMSPAQEEVVTVSFYGMPAITLAPLLSQAEELRAVNEVVKNPDLVQGLIDNQYFGPDELEDYGVLHFSGHGVAFPKAPERSFILLGSNPGDNPELLTVEELSQRSLPLELLVLSACQTNDGEATEGEGVIGLARAAALAGANAVVSTLWEVQQVDKPLFFDGYYRALSNDRRRDDSVGEGQRAVRRNRPGGDHPYHWAGFYNLGEGLALPFAIE